MTDERHIDAAIEGARDMVESDRNVFDREAAKSVHDRGGGGGPSGGGGTAQGGGNSTAGPADDPTDPSRETGGPRGAGTGVSHTTGGRMPDDESAEGQEPDEVIKRETAVFEPGTGKKVRDVPR